MNGFVSKSTQELRDEAYELYKQANVDPALLNNENLKEKAANLIKHLSEAKSITASFVERSFIGEILNQVLDVSKSEKWDELPPPEHLLLTYEDMQMAAAAVQVILQSVFTDIYQLMKEIVSSNGKAQIQKIRESIITKNNFLQAAMNQFEKTKNANEQQRNAEITQAVTQLVASAVALGISGFGVFKTSSMVKRTVANNRAAKNLRDEFEKAVRTKKELGGETIAQIKDKQKALNDEIGKLKADINDPSKSKSRELNGKKLKQLEQKKVETDEALKYLEIYEENFKKGSKDPTLMSNSQMEKKNAEIEAETKLIHAENGLWSSFGQLSSSISGILNSVGSYCAADTKFKASTENLESQKEEFFKSISQQYSQDAIERYRSLAEAISNIIQTIKSIIQSVDATISKAGMA